MIKFEYIDQSMLTKEKYDALLRINKWLFLSPLTEIYVVTDNDDIKTVFMFDRSYANYLSGYITAGTKESERNKGYFEFGIYMMTEVFKSNPSLYQLFIDVDHKATDHVCRKYGLQEFSKGTYYLINENFDERYETLFNIIDEYDNAMEFIGDDEIMLSIYNLWLGLYNNEPENIEKYY